MTVVILHIRTNTAAVLLDCALVTGWLCLKPVTYYAYGVHAAVHRLVNAPPLFSKKINL